MTDATLYQPRRHGYAIEQRLRLIDFLLAQYGTFNRSALCDYFGISEQQASLDVRSYMAMAPGNMSYDISGKTYRRSENFNRIYQ